MLFVLGRRLTIERFFVQRIQKTVTGDAALINVRRHRLTAVLYK